MEDKKRRRIGIMGGTFNPVHVGHLLLAENAYSMFSLDEILFIPSGCPYMKDPNEILDGATRLRMTELSIRDNPHFFLSSMEIDRGGYTYTCQTLEQLEKENPDCDYFFIMGADSLFQMEEWREPEVIFQKAVILAAVREGRGTRDLEEKAKQLTERFRARIHLVPAGNIAISSSDIRRRIQEGRSIRYMVHEKVREYIEDNQLYPSFLVSRKICCITPIHFLPHQQTHAPLGKER